MIIALPLLVIGTIAFVIWYSFDSAASKARHRAAMRIPAGPSTAAKTEATEAAMLDDGAHRLYRDAQVSGQLGFRPFSPYRAIGTGLFFGWAAHDAYELLHDDHDNGFHPVDLDNLH